MGLTPPPPPPPPPPMLEFQHNVCAFSVLCMIPSSQNSSMYSSTEQEPWWYLDVSRSVRAIWTSFFGQKSHMNSSLNSAQVTHRSNPICCASHMVWLVQHTVRLPFIKERTPVSPCLVVSKLGRGQPNVKVAWIKKCTSFGVISCELTRSGRLESMGSSIQGIEGCHHSICNCRWCLYPRIHSPTQCNKHYQLITDII